MKINIDDIPLDDEKTYELLQKALTTGVFQLESGGMKRYLKQLEPTTFEDVIAMVALYRPGPMDWIPDFIARKHGRKKIVYIHPKLEPILKNTYGVAVYQEQVMQISQALAGFSLSEADILRKAVGKKIPELIREEKIKFIDGCVENGIEKKIAEKVFAFIEPFAGYGFNRSHAACYALIGYQTAYLKAHYPTEFMAALLTSDQNDIDRIAIEIEECRIMQIEVLPPDINESFVTFAAIIKPGEKEKRSALASARSKTSAKMSLRRSSRSAKEMANIPASPILSNASKPKISIKNPWKASRNAARWTNSANAINCLENCEKILNYSKDFQKNQSSNQVSLFGGTGIDIKMPEISLEPAEPAPKMTRLGWEKELLGLYVSEHPLAEFLDFFRQCSTPISEIDATLVNNTVTIGGIIDKVKKIFLKSQKSMAFVQLEDAGGQKMEAIVFPKTLEKYETLWEEGNIVLVTGKISDKDGTLKVLADEARRVNQDEIDRYDVLEKQRKKENIQRQNEQKLYITLPPNASSELLRQISTVLSSAPAGDCKVFLELSQGRLETPYRISYDPNISNKLQGNYKRNKN